MRFRTAATIRKHDPQSAIRDPQSAIRNPQSEIRNPQSEIRNEVVRPEGLEPPAYRFEACRSIQLSYGRALRSSPFYRALARSREACRCAVVKSCSACPPMFHRLWHRIAGAVSRFFQAAQEAHLGLLDQLQREIDEELNRRR